MKRLCLAALLSVTVVVPTAVAQEDAALIERLDSIAGC